MGDGWKWLIENPNWDWFKKGGHWDQIKKEDKAFLDENGFTDLFKEFDVSYINVTDEVWSGRIANPTEIKRLVESRFKPVQIEALYSMVPKKLYNLRGSMFISLAKLKMYATFTLKNLFGMIPDPARPWWHGPNGSRIARSIIDINKIYHSLFNVYGICEALNIMSFQDPEGNFSLLLPRMKYNIVKDLGIMAFGRNLVSLDAILLNLTDGLILAVDEINRAPIDLAKEEVGIVAPVSAVIAASLPALVGIASEGLPKSNEIIGIILALISIWIVSSSGSEGKLTLAKIRTPVIAGIGFSVFKICLAGISSSSILWPLFFARIASLMILTGLVHSQDRFEKPNVDHFLNFGTIGILDASGGLLFLLAVQYGRLDIAAVFSSIHPAFTVFLAFFLFQERIQQKKWVGIIGIIISMILISF